MIVKMYRLKCLTNLHMGGSGIGYSIVDLEVERDPVSGEPTMNSTGIKGALRDWFSRNASVTAEETDCVFGKAGKETTQGACKFFSGDLLARPVPVSDGNASFMLGTTHEMLHQFFDKALLLNAATTALVYPAQGIRCGSAIRSVLNIPTTQETNQNVKDCFHKIFEGDNWVVMEPDQLKTHPLAVQAHNVLKNGKSDNLWYEEVVPHESVFGMLVGYPDESSNAVQKLQDMLCAGPVVQFGSGASTGEGYIRITEMNL